jgi:hypothetical protein
MSRVIADISMSVDGFVMDRTLISNMVWAWECTASLFGGGVQQ